MNTAPVVGNLTRQEVWDSHTSTWLATTNAYDTFGNVISTTDPRNNTTTFVYDAATKAQPVQITVNPLNGTGTQTTSLVYDFWTGSVTSQTDPNQKTTTMSYHNHLLGSIDPFGRPGTVTAPLVASTVNGVTTNHQRRVETRYHDSQRMVEVWSDLNASGDMKLRSRATTDKLGRTVKTETSENGSAYTISTQAVYHQAGRIVMSRNPHRGAGGESTDGWTRTTADDIGRVVEVATFNGAAQPPISGGSWNGRVTTDYKGIYTEVTDQAGKLRRSLVDGLGRLIEIHEPNEFGSLGSITSPVQKTSYLYDVLDNLIQVNQGSQQRLFTYDSLSRLRTAKNPEQLMQATTYNYDDAGNLTSKLNPNSTSVMFTYDGLNRVKTKTLSTGEAYTYNYDTGANGKGRMVSVVRQGGSDGYYYDGYDSLGRVTASRQVTTAGGATRTYTMSYGYDLAGDMTKEVYPSGKEYRMSYDDAGRISSASRYISGVFDKTYASQFSYTPHGAMSQMTLGNNTRETMAYNPRLQVTQIEMRKVAGNELLLGLDYGYAPTTNNGNIQSQTIRIGHQGATTTISQSYVYDSLNRLQSATETAGWNQSYGFDRYGNRAVTAGYVPTPVLTPQSLGEFNALTNRISACVYDTSGNMLQDQASGSYQYDAENRQVIYNSGAASYEYDGDGRRVKKVVGGETTVFVYNAGGQLVAEYTSGNAATNGTSYLTSDHLGSTRVVTGQDGSVKSRRDYLPFGEEIASTTGGRSGVTGYGANDGLRQQFTSKERDDESGLDYFLARYYSSAQGRFTSPDSVAGYISNPQSLNLYVYVRNNPLRYIDPTGHYAIGAVKTLSELTFGINRGYATSILGPFAPEGWQPNESDSGVSLFGQLIGSVLAAIDGGTMVATGHAMRGGGPVLAYAGSAFIGAGTYIGLSAGWNIKSVAAIVLAKQNGGDSEGTGGGASQEVEVSLGSPSPNQSEARTPSSVEDIVAGATRIGIGKKSPKSKQFSKSGGIDQANADFDALNPSNVQDRGNGIRTGELPDGSNVVVRPGSTTGKPTLQVNPPTGKPTKIRYE